MKKVVKLAVLLCAMLLAAGILAQSSDQPKAAENKTDKPPETAPETGAASDYMIGSDDVLHISVWKEPDLSEQLPVRPDGKISMPLLNDVQAARTDSAAVERFDYRETEEIHGRPTRHGGRPCHE